MSRVIRRLIILILPLLLAPVTLAQQPASSASNSHDQQSLKIKTNEVLLDGKSLSLTGLSDFVANLERSGYFQKSVEIVSSTTDTSGGPQGEVIKFQIKAVFKGPGDVEASNASDAKGANSQLKKKS